MKAKPFQPAHQVGAYIIDELIHLGETVKDTTYKCTSSCCGKPFTLQHFSLHESRRAKRTMCRLCGIQVAHQGTRDKGSSIVGEKYGFFEVTGFIGGLTYQVRRRCCGVEEQREYKQIYLARYHNQMRCSSCRAKGVAPVDTVQAGLEALGIISAALAWPRPRSLAA